MDFGFILTSCFDIFLYLSAPLVLVIFDNHSIRKRVSCKSKGIKSNTFSTYFVDFVSSSFFHRLGDFLKPFEAPLGTIFEKKTIPKITSKTGAPPLEKVGAIPVSDGSQRRRLACALLNSNNSSSSNSCSNSNSSSSCCSNSCPNSCLSSNCCSNSCPNCCLSRYQNSIFHDLITHWAEARRV